MNKYISSNARMPDRMRRLYLIVFMVAASYAAGYGQGVKSYMNGDLQLYYEESGQGPALYILSGGPGEAPEHPYRQIVDSLKAFYTCILVHQRGSGLSRGIPVNKETITIAKYTEDLDLIRKARGDRKISLLGVSWGGLLAMNYAARHSEYVAELILICSAPPSYTLWNVLYDNQYSRRSRVELDSMEILMHIFSTKTEQELDSLKHASPGCKEVLAYKDFIALHVRAMYYDRNKIDYAYLDDLFYSFNFQPIPLIDQEVLETKWDITNQLKSLNIPALLIYGRQDDQGESTFYLQKECLKYSETHVIEKCGHEILEEQPEEFFRILMSFVRQKDR